MRARLLKPGRLFWKLFAAFSLATGTSFVVGVFFVQLLSANPVPLAPAFEVPARIAQVIEREGVEAARPMLDRQHPVGRIALVMPDGRFVAGARNVDANAPSIAVTGPDGTRYRLRVRPADAFDPNRTVPVLIGALVSLFFSAGVAWYLARPLTHLSRGFREAGAGQLATRLHPYVGTRRDEIADLTREFDSMAAQLQKLLASQERLLHDVSHELRSPLTRLQVAIGLLRQSPESLPNMLARVDREVERLNHLIEEVLTLARLKSGAPELPTSRIDVIDLLTAIVDDANFEARTKGCEVRFNPEGGFVMMAHGELLYRAYENVIRNAVRFSPEGSAVDVTAAIAAGLLTVHVADRGPGVPAEMLEEMLEPFKGVDSAAETGGMGFGLGLAIAKHSVERHGGRITVRLATPGPGLIVEIILPAGA